MTPLMSRSEALSLRLWQREMALKERGLIIVEPQYCIVWAGPDDLDAPSRITSPSPVWLSLALHGNVLPPVSIYPLPLDERGCVIKDHGMHEEVIPAMSEERAMEYLLRKDVPQRVWNAPPGPNFRRFVITKRSLIPTDRAYRNAWRLSA